MESKNRNWWKVELETKPDFNMAMKRIYAWYEGSIIDRVPIRFSRHNVEYENVDSYNQWQGKELKKRWFDTEYQLNLFKNTIQAKSFKAETFPVYWPNLGPDVYAAFFGNSLRFGEITSWSEPLIKEGDDISHIKFDKKNQYFVKLEQMMSMALTECEGKYLVGYTDLHTGLDCVMAWMGQNALCLDLYDNPQNIKQLLELATRDFNLIYDHFDSILKQNNQLSVTWMEIPSFEKIHIPSCDFSALISPEHFREFYLPYLKKEVTHFTHNIFHMDGRGVANHLDAILEISQISAIQWVQGVGKDKPILQWIPLIKKIQRAGKSVVVDLHRNELEEFIQSIKPEGLFICIESENEEMEDAIINRIEKW